MDMVKVKPSQFFLNCLLSVALCVLDFLNRAVNNSRSKVFFSFPVPDIWHRQV